MVQIVPAVQKKPSFGQRLNVGIGRGLEQEAQRQALENFGIDPSISALPEQAQAAYFKQKFAPEKQMTPLQLAQQQLAEERLNALKGQQNIYGRLFGGQEQDGQQDMSSSPQTQDGFDLSKIPEEKLRQGAAFAGQPGEAGVFGNMFKAELERQSEEKKFNFEKEKLRRKEETEISKPILLELNEARKNIPLQEQAIQDIKNASPKVGALDYFADVTGFEPLRSAEGVKLKTGIKDFFLSDLSRAGARPNMWIEQQLADALPKIGRSPEANLITAEGMQFKLDLAKKRIDLIDDFAEKDREKFGFVRADIDSRAGKEMKKYAIDRQEELKNNIKKIKAFHKGKKAVVRVKSPDGSLYEIDSKDLDEALEHDFTIEE